MLAGRIYKLYQVSDQTYLLTGLVEQNLPIDFQKEQQSESYRSAMAIRPIGKVVKTDTE
jgi:hypothetical protein